MHLHQLNWMRVLGDSEYDQVGGGFKFLPFKPSPEPPIKPIVPFNGSPAIVIVPK